MRRTTSFQALMILAGAALLVLPACRAPFMTRVVDLHGTPRMAYYEGEAMDLQVYWDAKQDATKEVTCRITNTFTGEIEWRGAAVVPEVRAGSLKTLIFEPPLPADGQLRLMPGTYRWTCDLDEWTRSALMFDIRGR